MFLSCFWNVILSIYYYYKYFCSTCVYYYTQWKIHLGTFLNWFCKIFKKVPNVFVIGCSSTHMHYTSINNVLDLVYVTTSKTLKEFFCLWAINLMHFLTRLLYQIESIFWRKKNHLHFYILLWQMSINSI